MSSNGHRRGTVPVDLVLVIAAVVLLNFAVFAPIVRETPIRVPVAVAFVLFVPGYVVVAALYPDDTDLTDCAPVDDPDSLRSGRLRSGIGSVERVGLSFALSFVIVPALGFPLARTYNGVHLTSTTAALTAFTLIVTAIATVRRRNLPEEEQFSVPIRSWLATGRSSALPFDGWADAALTVLLVVSLLLVAGSVGFAAVNLPQDDEFSSLSLLTETENGELTADGLPTEVVEEEPAEFIVEVENHEHRTTEYTLVAVEQSLESGNENGETAVGEERELHRTDLSLNHGETERLEYELKSSLADEETRVVWLLYVDDAPEDPSIDDAPYYVDLVVEFE
ncbi:DUF1616 domain-containing protein [Natronorubrum bangense]|nr:DUF1616 domain-containing protein [Natronorubrum bangense]